MSDDNENHPEKEPLKIIWKKLNELDEDLKDIQLNKIKVSYQELKEIQKDYIDSKLREIKALQKFQSDFNLKDSNSSEDHLKSTLNYLNHIHMKQNLTKK